MTIDAAWLRNFRDRSGSNDPPQKGHKSRAHVWNKEQDDEIRAWRAQSFSWENVAKLMHLPYKVVYRRGKQLGLAGLK